MKKSFFYLAMAACVAVCNISCGSDDDGGGSSPDAPVVLPKAPYDSQASTLTLPPTAVVDNNSSLTGLTFTESGKAIIKVNTPGGVKYVTNNYKVSGNVYTISDNSGKEVGKVEFLLASAPSRSTGNVNIQVSLEVTIPGLGTFNFSTSSATTAQQAIQTYAATTNTSNIARTWTVQEMKLTLEGDVSASINEKSGNLGAFVKEAQDRGADLTEDEVKELQKTIKGLTLDKNGLFSIEYSGSADGSEACGWQWTDANQTKLKLQLRDSEFGNKFLSNNSTVDVKFYTSGICHFTLVTDINTGSKKYKATLLIVMK